MKKSLLSVGANPSNDDINARFTLEIFGDIQIPSCGVGGGIDDALGRGFLARNIATMAIKTASGTSFECRRTANEVSIWYSRWHSTV